jgi:RNA polymerase sigma-70 factor (ECF subfamily)
MSLLFKRDPLTDPDALIRRVYAYVAYRLGDGPDAEDVTSDVFERALRYRNSYDRSKGEPVAWLLGIASRCTSAALASRTEAPLLADHDAGSSGFEEDSVQRLTLAAALEGLSDRDQELIALRYGADLTSAQIARVLDLKTNAVEVALHRAIDRLRSILVAESQAEEEDAGAGETAPGELESAPLRRRSPEAA